MVSYRDLTWWSFSCKSLSLSILDRSINRWLNQSVKFLDFDVPSTALGLLSMITHSFNPSLCHSLWIVTLAPNLRLHESLCHFILVCQFLSQPLSSTITRMKLSLIVLVRCWSLGDLVRACGTRCVIVLSPLSLCQSLHQLVCHLSLFPLLFFRLVLLPFLSDLFLLARPFS